MTTAYVWGIMWMQQGHFNIMCQLHNQWGHWLKTINLISLPELLHVLLQLYHDHLWNPILSIGIKFGIPGAISEWIERYSKNELFAKQWDLDSNELLPNCTYVHAYFVAISCNVCQRDGGWSVDTAVSVLLAWNGPICNMNNYSQAHPQCVYVHSVCLTSMINHS